MVMKVEPLVACIEAVRAVHAPARIVLLGAGGTPFTQRVAEEMSDLGSLALVCGHYEGVDARVAEWVDMEVSIGDYVLTGGEPAALVLIDAITRLLPGVLGNAESIARESYASGVLLEHPHYTRPRSFRGREVPPVLLGGHHGHIERWRRQQSLLTTRRERPDLFARHTLTAEDAALVAEADALAARDAGADEEGSCSLP
jgi:tRNA (guanine37-N1)-methyltransferase